MLHYIFLPDEALDCSEGELWEKGIEVPLSLSDFVDFTRYNMISTTEAAELMNCSRQHISSSVKAGHITPVKEYQKNRLFVKADIIKLVR